VKPSHKRNEILDCTVYSLAAAYHLGMNKFSARDWKTLEDRVQPTTKDLFAANIDEIMQKNVTIQKKTPENEKVLVDKPAQRVHPRKEKAGFANNW